jgi:hypothetical protein
VGVVLLVAAFEAELGQRRQHGLRWIVGIGRQVDAEGLARRLGRDIDLINARRLHDGGSFQKQHVASCASNRPGRDAHQSPT